MSSMQAYERSDGNWAELKRVIGDVRDEIAEVGSEADYLKRTAASYKESAAYTAIMRPVETYGSLSFRMQLGKFASNHAAMPGGGTRTAIPALYLSQPFKTGIAFGVALNEKMYGHGLGEQAQPHIQAEMQIPGIGYREYAEEIETIGLNYYWYNMANVFKQNKSVEDPLRHLTHDIAAAAYQSSEIQSRHFKAGTGLAARSIRGYLQYVHHEFTAIVRK